jgi:hypothetical protein
MAVTPVQPVQRPQEITRQTRKSGGRIGQIIGGIGGAVIGATTANPGLGAAAAGALTGAATGAGLGGIAGESIQPAKFRTGTRPTPSGGLPPLQLSRNGQLMAESLQILQQMPKELSSPHSRSLTAALMQDLAQNSGVA